jgi:hypothetical protein
MSIAASEHSPNFVLVHGAWHGGWCWKRLSPLLRALGHDALRSGDFRFHTASAGVLLRFESCRST